MNNHVVHFDCDPGQDDAIAYLFALGAGVQFSSISVVGGNVDVQQCARNMLQLLELTGKTQTPVYIGAAQPLKRLAMPLPDVFGESGMDGASLPLPTLTASTTFAVDFLTKAKLPSTLVATGPLTNIALAIQQSPTFPEQIDHLIIMGGCTKPEHIHGRMGNIQVKGSEDWAEYNFAVDPEAAKIVFTAGFKKISVIGIDITRTVLYNGAIDKRLRENGNNVSITAANILATVGKEDQEDYKSQHAYVGDPVRGLHDVVALAFLTNPEIFQSVTMPIRIVTDEPPAAAGQSLIDAIAPDHPSVNVITDLDRQVFINMLTKYLQNL